MKIRSVKEQYEQRNICLRERLEQILPQVMRESEADLWLHASKEYHEDPTFRALTPADYPTARRVTMFAFVKDGDEDPLFSEHAGRSPGRILHPILEIRTGKPAGCLEAVAGTI